MYGDGDFLVFGLYLYWYCVSLVFFFDGFDVSVWDFDWDVLCCYI